MSVVRLHLPGAAEYVRVRLTGREFHYLVRVRRLSEGDEFEAFDGRGASFAAVLGRPGAGSVEIGIGRRLVAGSAVRDGPELVLMQAALRDEKMRFVVQKCAELGAHRLVVFEAGRGAPGPDAGKLGQRLERWNRIAAEACRQCGRSDMATVEAAGFTSLTGLQRDELGLVCLPGAPSLGTFKDVAPTPSRIIIAVGPEGGFTQEEAARLDGQGFSAAGLGPRVLRTETAGMVALAIVQSIWGDLS